MANFISEYNMGENCVIVTYGIWYDIIWRFCCTILQWKKNPRHFSHACYVFSVLNVTKVIQTKQRKKERKKKQSLIGVEQKQ